MPNRRSGARQRLEVQIPRLWTEDQAHVSKVANRQAQDPASGVADHHSSITGVEFPSSYSLFLSWINVLNFDLGYILSASCVLPSVNFYGRLLATTISPFVVAAGLALTYHMAKRWAGIGSAGVRAKTAAWSRHIQAGLLLTFLVMILCTGQFLAFGEATVRRSDVHL